MLEIRDSLEDMGHELAFEDWVTPELVQEEHSMLKSRMNRNTEMRSVS